MSRELRDADVELLLALIGGKNMSDLGRDHSCTPQNIKRKVDRAKELIGWRFGMTRELVLERVERLRANRAAGDELAARCEELERQLREVERDRDFWRGAHQVDCKEVPNLRAEVERLSSRLEAGAIEPLTCPCCGVGRLAERRMAVCSECGSEVANPDQIRANAQAYREALAAGREGIPWSDFSEQLRQAHRNCLVSVRALDNQRNTPRARARAALEIEQENLRLHCLGVKTPNEREAAQAALGKIENVLSLL